jgi:signal transduction histidine kinase
LTARIVLAREEGGFDEVSLEVLGHMLERVVPVLQYAGLLEQLAAEAVETERARIGRDLHDSAIQPYIGLKFAVEALAQRCTPDNPILPYVQQLAEMTNEELASMRDMIAGLRSHRSGADPLLAGAVRRQAERFGQLFGISVEVSISGEMPVSRRLSGELFHMVSEGLSNIRRHTRSRQAWVSLTNDGDALTLHIRNRTDPGASSNPRFTPHSIAERAASLGGSIDVDTSADLTTITVCVPVPGAGNT